MSTVKKNPGCDAMKLTQLIKNPTWSWGETCLKLDELIEAGLIEKKYMRYY